MCNHQANLQVAQSQSMEVAAAPAARQIAQAPRAPASATSANGPNSLIRPFVGPNNHQMWPGQHTNPAMYNTVPPEVDTTRMTRVQADVPYLTGKRYVDVRASFPLMN